MKPLHNDDAKIEALDKKLWWQRLLWLLTIWCLSVLALGVVAGAMRLLMSSAGLVAPK
ncbi:MAG: hypothetical protein JWM78_1479 [Verrucomicrobiaceae bacterium]|nr:hypothetical protein [Verrucomicrobiaceae bacterium]